MKRMSLSQRPPKLSMAADAAGITMDGAACRKTNRGTGHRHVTTGRRHVITSRPGRSCALISAGGETRRDIPRQIRPLKRGTIARRISRFRTACVSHTEDVKPAGRAAEECRLIT
jgi:hypothetical protein